MTSEDLASTFDPFRALLVASYPRPTGPHLFPAMPTTPRDSIDLPDVLRFMQLLWAVAHGLDARSKHMANRIGVTGPQRLALRVVGLAPGVSAGDLARALHLHPSTLTGILQRLVKQGLITRAGDPGDGRRIRLRLTPLGSRVNRTTRETVEQSVADALDGVNASDRAGVRRVLERLAAHLEVERPDRSPARPKAARAN